MMKPRTPSPSTIRRSFLDEARMRLSAYWPHRASSSGQVGGVVTTLRSRLQRAPLVRRWRDILWLAMAVIISMLRGVNLGPHRRLKMEELRGLYEALKLREPQSYVQ